MQNSSFLRTFQEKDFHLRLITMLLGVLGMGVFLSFLIMVDYGVSTFSFFALGFSSATGISYGTCTVITHVLCVLPVLLWARDLIHLGTLANMFLCGYICDFCRWLWARILPEAMFTVQPWRSITFAAALLLFLVCAALYMNASLGLSPFDAVPRIISSRLKLPFVPVRMAWDFAFIALGMLGGQKLMLTTIILAFATGPAVGLIGRWMKRFFKTP